VSTSGKNARRTSDSGGGETSDKLAAGDGGRQPLFLECVVGGRRVVDSRCSSSTSWERGVRGWSTAAVPWTCRHAALQVSLAGALRVGVCAGKHAKGTSREPWPLATLSGSRAPSASSTAGWCSPCRRSRAWPSSSLSASSTATAVEHTPTALSSLPTPNRRTHDLDL